MAKGVDEKAWRAHIAKLLDWEDAHVGFPAAVKGIPPSMRGFVPDGWDHSAWQLVEHIRVAQADILEFCIDPKYKAKKWPDDYWPASPKPRNGGAWTASIAAVRSDCDTLKQLANNPKIDLVAEIPHGEGQTYLRELLLVADHTAYHVGQIIALRRQVGIWPR
jgi:uncharacterized damage-inducible protein DinB